MSYEEDTEAGRRLREDATSSAIPGEDGLVEMEGGVTVKPGTHARRAGWMTLIPWWGYALGMAIGLYSISGDSDDR